MHPKILKVKSWISSSFQFVTIILLLACLIFNIKQQKEISTLSIKVDLIDRSVSESNSNIDDLNKKVDDLDVKLDEVESSLSGEIDDVASTVRIYSH